MGPRRRLPPLSQAEAPTWDQGAGNQAFFIVIWWQFDGNHMKSNPWNSWIDEMWPSHFRTVTHRITIKLPWYGIIHSPLKFDGMSSRMSWNYGQAPWSFGSAEPRWFSKEVKKGQASRNWGFTKEKMIEIVDLWLSQLTFPILMGSFIIKYLGHLIKLNGTLVTQHFTRHWGNEQKMGFHHQNVVSLVIGET